MQIEERPVGEVIVLDLKGKVTLGDGDQLLKDKVNSLVNQGQRKILLNLESVPYIDSAGLGEIVRTYTTVSRQGGSLKLVNLTKRITDLLSITKLLTVFETFDSERRRSGVSRPPPRSDSESAPRGRAVEVPRRLRRDASAPTPSRQQTAARTRATPGLRPCPNLVSVRTQ